MIQITFDRNKGYFLICPMQQKANRIEIYFSGYNDDINYRNGFLKWFKKGPDEAYIKKGLPVPEPKIIADYSDYKYKWNVITHMDNGIVLTNDPNNVETENDNFNPMTTEEAEEMQKEIAKMVEEASNEISTEERIEILEAELKALKDKQK